MKLGEEIFKGHFTDRWVGQDVMNEKEVTTRVRVQRDYGGNVIWIRIYEPEIDG